MYLQFFTLQRYDSLRWETKNSFPTFRWWISICTNCLLLTMVSWTNFTCKMYLKPSTDCKRQVPSCCIAALILSWLREKITTHCISVSSAALILLISLSFILALFAERATSERAVQHRRIKIAARVPAKCGTPCYYFVPVCISWIFFF